MDNELDIELEKRIKELKEINSRIMLVLCDLLKYKTNELCCQYEFYTNLWNKKYQELKEYAEKNYN